MAGWLLKRSFIKLTELSEMRKTRHIGLKKKSDKKNVLAQYKSFLKKDKPSSEMKKRKHFGLKKKSSKSLLI